MRREFWECRFCGAVKGGPPKECTAEDGEGHLFMKIVEEYPDPEYSPGAEVDDG